MNLNLITPLDTPSYEKLIDHMAEAAWPEFMLHDPIADQHWDNLFSRSPEYQFALLDRDNGRVAAMGNSVALNWDENLDDLPEAGWDWAFQQAISDHEMGLQPRTQCAIQIAIHPDYRSQGLSSHMVTIMREIGQKRGFKTLIALYAPIRKAYID